MKPLEVFAIATLAALLAISFVMYRDRSSLKECREMCSFGAVEFKDGNCTCWKMQDICPPRN
jgi:hypothetical protein